MQKPWTSDIDERVTTVTPPKKKVTRVTVGLMHEGASGDEIAEPLPNEPKPPSRKRETKRDPLTPAEKQKRYRDKKRAADKATKEM